MQSGNKTLYENLKNATSIQNLHIPNWPYSDILFLQNGTSLLTTNFTDEFFDDLWLVHHPHDWRTEALTLFSQPAYVIILFLCIMAIIANTISIIAVNHTRPPQTMHLRLIINLAASDIAIVFSVLGHILNKIFNNPFAPGVTDPVDRLINGCIYATLSSINVLTYLISLFNVLTMAVDHYIAIMLPLTYHRIMSRKHGYVLISILWVIATLGGFSNFFFGGFSYGEKQDMFNYCEYILFDSYQAEYLMFAATFLCLAGIIYIYFRIYCEVLKIQNRCCIPDETLHNRKALMTTLLIIGTFCLCWLPNCILNLVLIVQLYVNNSVVYDVNTIVIINKYLYILQVTNAFLDPIIYAIRLNVVKSGYRIFLNRLKRYWRKKLRCSGWKSRTPLVSTSRRPTTTQTQNMAAEMALFTSNGTSNHSTVLGESKGSNGFYTKSDESDANENELIAMVTIHSNDLHAILDTLNETEL